jgi:hypothetical protein
MVSPWDFQYLISGWMLAGLVVVPFCFGLLYGMRVAHKRFMVKLVKIVTPEQLQKLMDKKKGVDETENRESFPTNP